MAEGLPSKKFCEDRMVFLEKQINVLTEQHKQLTDSINKMWLEKQILEHIINYHDGIVPSN